MKIVIHDHVTVLLDAVRARTSDLTPISEAVGTAVVSLTMRSFNDPSVRAAQWAPLKAATLAAKVREGTSTAILKRHVLLARSWRITELASDYVRVGSDRFYAAFHQFGTKHTPARPMLPIWGNRMFTPLAIRRMASAAKRASAYLFSK